MFGHAAGRVITSRPRSRSPSSSDETRSAVAARSIALDVRVECGASMPFLRISAAEMRRARRRRSRAGAASPRIELRHLDAEAARRCRRTRPRCSRRRRSTMRRGSAGRSSASFEVIDVLDAGDRRQHGPAAGRDQDVLRGDRGGRRPRPCAASTSRARPSMIVDAGSRRMLDVDAVQALELAVLGRRSARPSRSCGAPTVQP